MLEEKKERDELKEEEEMYNHCFSVELAWLF